MATKVETPKRRHSFSSLQEVAKELEEKAQQVTMLGTSRNDRKRSHSPNAASEGSSPKKAALAAEPADEFLCLPGGELNIEYRTAASSLCIKMRA